MRQNLFFQKNATPDDLRIAWILNIFTVSGAWERYINFYAARQTHVATELAGRVATAFFP